MRTAIAATNTAVRVLPGTELAFADRVTCYGRTGLYHTMATFRQVPRTHDDALEFPDGRMLLMSQLWEGQEATVLQLPAQPFPTQPITAAETKAQKRIRNVR